MTRIPTTPRQPWMREEPKPPRGHEKWSGWLCPKCDSIKDAFYRDKRNQERCIACDAHLRWVTPAPARKARRAKGEASRIYSETINSVLPVLGIIGESRVAHRAALVSVVAAWDALIADRCGVDIGVLPKDKLRDLAKWQSVMDAMDHARKLIVPAPRAPKGRGK